MRFHYSSSHYRYEPPSRKKRRIQCARVGATAKDAISRSAQKSICARGVIKRQRQQQQQQPADWKAHRDPLLMVYRPTPPELPDVTVKWILSYVAAGLRLWSPLIRRGYFFFSVSMGDGKQWGRRWWERGENPLRSPFSKWKRVSSR